MLTGETQFVAKPQRIPVPGHSHRAARETQSPVWGRGRQRIYIYVYTKGRNTQFRKVWEVPTRILKRWAKESLTCYQLTPQFTELGGSWRILERENWEIRRIQTQLSPEHQKDAEAIANPRTSTCKIMSRVATDRSHQTFHFSFGQVSGPSGEAVLPLDLSKDFDPTPPYSHQLIISHMKISCREEKKKGKEHA